MTFDKMPRIAVACFQRKVSGCVVFKQRSARSKVYITVALKLRGKDGEHGFHIHTSGDMRAADCSKCGGHWNPKGSQHGSREQNAFESHAGDLGNVMFVDGECSERFHTSKITLFGDESILGRSIVLHKDRDDLGQGTGPKAHDSKRTGNAGARLGCAVIGIV